MGPIRCAAAATDASSRRSMRSVRSSRGACDETVTCASSASAAAAMAAPKRWVPPTTRTVLLANLPVMFFSDRVRYTRRYGKVTGDFNVTGEVPHGEQHHVRELPIAYRAAAHRRTMDGVHRQRARTRADAIHRAGDP